MHRFIANSLLVSFSFLIQLTVQMAATEAYASTVDKVSATQALVTFDGGETPAAGDKFFAIENGKKRAILEVVQFKNGKAKVKILKGKPAVGMTLALAKSKSKAQASGSNSDGESEDKNDHTRSAGAATLFKDITIGLVGGYSLDSQTVTPGTVGQISRSMSGSGFSAKAFVDVPVTSSLALLARFGGEQFNVKSDTVKTEILYGVADLLLKYSFTEGGLVPFAMAGLGIHFPFSKASDVLNQNNISPTTVFYGGAGINYVIGGSSYLQLTGEYGMFPPSNEVSTSLIAVRAGFGFRF